jgi:hypothetical protein
MFSIIEKRALLASGSFAGRNVLSMGAGGARSGASGTAGTVEACWGLRFDSRRVASYCKRPLKIASADWLRGVRCRSMRLSELGSDFLASGVGLPRDANEPIA